jgi:asparagine synthase (glutamine-hydrolysing)
VKQSLCFSWDITGLCRAFSEGGIPDSEYLMASFKYIDRTKTPDSRVKKLLPGHFLRFSDDGTELTKYWKPEKIKTEINLTYSQMISDLNYLVADSVKIRCDERFTAGAHVTGGLDSGIVSTLVRREYRSQDRFYGFSWTHGSYNASGTTYDEREIIIPSCSKTGIIPVFSDMNTEDLKRYVADYYHNQGYFQEDKASDQAAERYVNLIFSGWGGDEFISTGDRGIETDLLRRFKWRIFFRRNHVRETRKFIKYFLYYVIYPAAGIIDRGTERSFRQDALYLKSPYKQSDKRAIRNFYFHISRRQLHLRLLNLYHLPERCEIWAINGFRKGIEYRYPLLDRRIIEYMLKVPSELLCMTGDYRPLIRVIGEGILPEEVRRQLDKSDPVCWRYNDELFKEAALSYINETGNWKMNPDLFFIDFIRLEKDTERYSEHAEEVPEKALFKSLVYIKAINEFTKKYHRKD